MWHKPMTILRFQKLNGSCERLSLTLHCYHWLGAYRTNALYSGHIFVRFNDLEDVFT